MPRPPENGPAAVFRTEALDARRQSWIGGTRVPVTWLQTTMAITASASVIALLCVLTLCSYTRLDIATGLVAATNDGATNRACIGQHARLEAVIALNESQFRRLSAGQGVNVATTASGHSTQQRGCVAGMSPVPLAPGIASQAFARPFNAPVYVARITLPATNDEATRVGVTARVVLGGERRRLYEWMLPAVGRHGGD